MLIRWRAHPRYAVERAGARPVRKRRKARVRRLESTPDLCDRGVHRRGTAVALPKKAEVQSKKITVNGGPPNAPAKA